MREEIAAAVVFLTRVVRQCGSIANDKMESFSDSLSAALVERYKNHWYNDHPAKGQAYRCIRISPEEPVDPVIERALSKSNLGYRDLMLYCELTLWVDPSDVCFRFGESYGAICTLATSKDGNMENKAHTVDIDEYLQKEKDRYNNQVNIVTTRSNTSSRPYANNHNLVYSGYHYNHHRHHRSSSKRKQQEQQVNGVRYSPDHVNEVRKQFLNQVNSIAGKSKSDDEQAMSLSSDDGGSLSDSSKSPDQSPEKSQKKNLQSTKAHHSKGKNTSNLNQGKSRPSSQGVKQKSGEYFWGKAANHTKFNQAQKVH